MNDEELRLSGYIYIFTDSAFPDCVKVGMSINPRNRLVQYNLDKPFATTEPYHISKPFQNIKRVEQDILKILNTELTKNTLITAIEWFDIKDLEFIKHTIDYAEIFSSLDETLPQLTLEALKEKPTKMKVVYESALDKALAGKVPKYSDLCKEYVMLMEGEPSPASEAKLRSITVLEPTISQAYEELGADKMKALKFIKKYFTKETKAQVMFQSQGATISNLLKLQSGKFYSSKELKETLQSAYDKVGVTKVAKATDITTWYEIKNQSTRINGVNTAGITVIAPKSSLTFTL